MTTCSRRRTRASRTFAASPEIVKRQEQFLKGALRVDIFGLREGGSIDDRLIAPLRPKVLAVKRGQRYLLEVVLRTLNLAIRSPQGNCGLQ